MFGIATVILGVFTALSSASFVTLNNNCEFQVDAAFYPTVEFNQTQTGGFALNSTHPSATVLLANDYDGQIWGRTGCDANGNCATGQCPGGESCTGPTSGTATIAQFALNVTNGQDSFGVSEVDGYNIPVTITPGPGCSVAAVDCTGPDGEGNGCGQTFQCTTTTAYTLTFC
ncbi:Osmotin thaumatin-like protein [Fomitopsis serialis]|uniref:Osmotin thaumatin-like protein n=1 Tax=Fomitopsis serialis TaxID=139415 RepID=UPI002007C7C0|nr:Osmotin thaumatin-like protein [Neoantrodia serialis]KAH9922748.1 Osmotin thaumatin-like protein [Neoantrodia serialis]